MKRPSFQFYPSDWRSNGKLRRCSEAARGAWMDILGTLHDSEEYGICRWPLADLAQSAGVKLKSAKELVAKNVLKGADRGPVRYVFTPRHAGKDGDPVTLLETEGPCWFSSRMVRDEWVRSRRGQSTQFTTENQPPKASPKPTPKPPIGERQGDGPSTSSSSPISEAKASSIKPRVRSAMDEPDGFAEFYAAFPRKTARRAAARAYASALKRAPAPTLLQGAMRYAAERAHEDQNFTKHPATWLNQDCWLDEPVSRETHGGRHGGRTHNQPAHESFGAGLLRSISEDYGGQQQRDFPEGGGEIIDVTPTGAQTRTRDQAA